MIGKSKPSYEHHDASAGERQDQSDCQVRALSTARGIGYWAAWELLYKIQGERRCCSMQLVEALRDGDERLCVVRPLKFAAVRGKPRMIGKQFCAEHPTGRYILRMAHHVAAVVDGVLYDTWNSTGKCVYGAWEVSQ